MWLKLLQRWVPPGGRRLGIGGGRVHGKRRPCRRGGRPLLEVLEARWCRRRRMRGGVRCRRWSRRQPTAATVAFC